MELLARLITEISWESLIASALRILLILIVAWIVMSTIKIALRQLTKKLMDRGRVEGEPPTESAKRAETLVRLLRQAVAIALWVVVTLIVLREVGVEIGPILASAGIVGLAVGFGAQNLVRDVISGFFMILENQIRVGDVAIVNGTGGVVEKINFRTVVLRDLSGVVHVFPNGAVSTLSNMTQEWSAYVLNMGVAYKEDVDKVMGVMRSVAAEMRADQYFGGLMIQDIELKTKPIKQWEVGREYRRRLKQAFDREGIEIPFPHTSIYFGEASKPFVAQLLNEQKATSS